MANKLMEDRIEAIVKACNESNIDFELRYDPVSRMWDAWVYSAEEPDFTADTFEDAIQAVEAELEL